MTSIRWPGSADVLSRIAQPPAQRLDLLLPWNWHTGSAKLIKQREPNLTHRMLTPISRLIG
jgi:hypothetical protein